MCKLLFACQQTLRSTLSRPLLCAGISVNMSAFAATILAEVAYDPRVLLPYSHMGEDHELVSTPLTTSDQSDAGSAIFVDRPLTLFYSTCCFCLGFD